MFKLPLAKTGKALKDYYIYDGTNWRDPSGNSVSTSIIKKQITDGEVTLESPDSVSIVSDSSSSENITVSSPANPQDVLALKTSIKNAPQKVKKVFTDALLSNMNASQIAGLKQYVDGIDANEFSDIDFGQAVIKFHPNLQIPSSRDDIAETMSQLDNPDYATRGGRTLKSVLDRFDDAKSKSSHRMRNLQYHPLGDLGQNSRDELEIVNTLLPEISEKPEVIKNKSALEAYDSDSKLIYRGLSRRVKRKADGTAVTDDNGNTVYYSSEELQKMFREASGTYWGRGYYGHGIYFAENVRESQNHYTDDAQNGVGVAKIKKGAHILDTESPNDPNHVMLISYAQQMLTAYLISQGLIPGSAEYRARYNEIWNDILDDQGSRAAFFGYDALYLSNKTFYVGLNRAALVLYDGTYGQWQNDQS
jgi:hypothetical protein